MLPTYIITHLKQLRSNSLVFTLPDLLCCQQPIVTPSSTLYRYCTPPARKWYRGQSRAYQCQFSIRALNTRSALKTQPTVAIHDWLDSQQRDCVPVTETSIEHTATARDPTELNPRRYTLIGRPRSSTHPDSIGGDTAFFLKEDFHIRPSVTTEATYFLTTIANLTTPLWKLQQLQRLQISRHLDRKSVV